ncbi:MAG TPA: hypothetical protein VGY54_01635 [Polyangiaceae bacterium]|nr:hypothetical protein [Polyangiaceae bacterium]
MLSRSPVISGILFRSLLRPEGDAALRYTGFWAGLRDLVGSSMAPETLLEAVGRLDRDQAFATLAMIAAGLANSDDGIFGDEANAKTRRLLTEGFGTSPLEKIISAAVAKLATNRPIVHAQAIFTLQTMAIVRGTAGAEQSRDAYLAYLILAVNDHIPEWPHLIANPVPSGEEMTETERLLVPLFLCGIFNRSSDDARFLLRILDVMGKVSARPLPRGVSWDDVERQAFGCPFATYAEAFLVPMIILAKGWGFDRAPVMDAATWDVTSTGGDLYRRWFKDASIPIDQAVTAFADRPLRSGLFGLSRAFFRTPFLQVRGKLVATSPWHLHDYASLGTWDKLNRACKIALNSDSNEVFSSTFGYSFECWCADLAREADSASMHPTERLILPSAPGAADEIEDVVFQDGTQVVLFSAKASLVPEARLKTADAPEDAIRWLRRFFFENAAAAKGHGHRGGAVCLLDKKAALIREGAFESVGIPRTATIFPAIVCFDHVENSVLYKWLEEESAKRGLLFHRGDVRSVTVVNPDNYEALMALRAKGRGICRLLSEKTEVKNKWRRLDDFLYHEVKDALDLRFPSIKQRFDALVSRSLERIRPNPCV